MAYTNDVSQITTFLKDFSVQDKNKKTFPYTESIVEIANHEKSAIYIQMEDVQSFNEELHDEIVKNTTRYQTLFAMAIDKLLPVHKTGQPETRDVLDIYIDHRIQKEIRLSEQQGNTNVTPEDVLHKLPSELVRKFEVYFKCSSDVRPISVRSVMSNKIGHLIKLKGVVYRTTEVKPLIRVATYTCGSCGSEAFQEITNTSFMPLLTCHSSTCKDNGMTNANTLQLQTRGSRFVKFQEIRVQELAESVPVGGIPKKLVIYARGENTRKALPGDEIMVSGVFLPIVSNDYDSAHGLLSKTFIEAHNISMLSKAADEKDINIDKLTNLADMERYTKLASSIAPEIYGHDDIKKALLLLLVGGTEITSGVAQEQMRIRGNINICLMGDPGVAKSQLLGFIHRVSPRSQYTTGRGSSGVGLTASVMKDPLTGEMCLEGGALVLADGGVCCIDEFDKMDENDRTAIHEVMEQQTISIAKAGILTTLNARVAILAAANPAYGRYNPNRTIEQNVDLPAALLSRFDLLWLIQDKADRENDMRLAEHITHVHRTGQAPKARQTDAATIDELRQFVNYVKSTPAPTVPSYLCDYLVGAYVELRKEARSGGDTTFTSPRTLLSIMRMSTALARLRGGNEVRKTDIDETMRLMESSRSSVIQSLLYENQGTRQLSYKDHVYQLIKELLRDDRTCRMTDVMDKCGSRGFTPAQIDEVVQAYDQLNVWQLNSAKTKLMLV